MSLPQAIPFPLDLPELSVDLNGGRVRRTVHPSGLRILTESMPGARSTAIGFWVGVGSRDEQEFAADAPASLGSTHFLEHLLFKGTPSRDAYTIATSFDAIGAEHNALTAKEYTCYYAKVRDLDLERAVTVLADMVTNSVLDRDEFENEREVILEELAMAADDLSDVASENFFAEVLQGHALGRPIGGNAETIRSATRDAVAEHYVRQYDPSTLVITAAGAVDHDRLVEQVLRELNAAEHERWHTTRSAVPRRRPQLHRGGETSESIAGLDASRLQGAMEHRNIAVAQRQSEQVHVMLGCPGLAAQDPQRFAFGIMNSVLGGGMSSRLFQEVREKRGLAYTAYSFGASYSDGGVFGMYAGTAPEKVQQVTELCAEVLNDIAQHGIRDDEHQRALGQIAGSSALALEDSETRMGRLARAELGSGELYDLDVSLARFAEVSAEDIRAVAKRFTAQPHTLVLVGDAEAAGFAEYLR